jgi:hypothetical protein
MVAVKLARFDIEHTRISSNEAIAWRQVWNSGAHPCNVFGVNQPLHSEFFPTSFPFVLAAAAFSRGKEVAWPPMLAARAVEWFGTHGYAVLGTELWLLQDEAIQSLPIGLSGKGEVHGNTVNRKSHEVWGSFVVRAAAETQAYLQSFKPSDIVEHGEVYFNVVWASEADYQQLVRV